MTELFFGTMGDGDGRYSEIVCKSSSTTEGGGGSSPTTSTVFLQDLKATGYKFMHDYKIGGGVKDLVRLFEDIRTSGHPDIKTGHRCGLGAVKEKKVRNMKKEEHQNTYESPGKRRRTDGLGQEQQGGIGEQRSSSAPWRQRKGRGRPPTTPSRPGPRDGPPAPPLERGARGRCIKQGGAPQPQRCGGPLAAPDHGLDGREGRPPARCTAYWLAWMSRAITFTNSWTKAMHWECLPIWCLQ